MKFEVLNKATVLSNVLTTMLRFSSVWSDLLALAMRELSCLTDLPADSAVILPWSIMIM